MRSRVRVCEHAVVSRVELAGVNLDGLGASFPDKRPWEHRDSGGCNYINVTNLSVCQHILQEASNIILAGSYGQYCLQACAAGYVHVECVRIHTCQSSLDDIQSCGLATFPQIRSKSSIPSSLLLRLTN